MTLKPVVVVNRPVANLWQRYCQQLERRPVLSRSLTGVVGACLGDSIAQASTRRATRRQTVTLVRSQSQAAVPVHDEPGYDWFRTIRLGLYSGLIGSPLGYKWYMLLDKLILPGASRSAAAVLLKTFCDQALWAPISTCLYLSTIRCMEGNADQALSTIRQKWRPCMMANYMVWPAAHMVNFALVPATQRILYINVVAVFWGAFMSKMVNNKTEAA